MGATRTRTEPQIYFTRDICYTFIPTHFNTTTTTRSNRINGRVTRVHIRTYSMKIENV